MIWSPQNLGPVSFHGDKDDSVMVLCNTKVTELEGLDLCLARVYGIELSIHDRRHSKIWKLAQHLE